LEITHEVLGDCPTDQYLLVSQPNLVADDLITGSSQNLRQILTGSGIQGKLEFPGVSGGIKVDDLRKYIGDACEKAGRSVDIHALRLDSLPVAGRAAQFSENGKDANLTRAESLSNHQLQTRS
jgi:hypothetical protein